MLPIVTIVGRSNVGKSTLFNRLIGKRQAVTCDYAGTTRDRLFESVTWNGTEFMLIDTAGFIASGGKRDELELKTNEQIDISINQANLVLLVVDATCQLTADDFAALRKIQKIKKPYLVVANKADNHQIEILSAELYRLQTDKIFYLSAISGRGSGDLLDNIVKKLPKKTRKKTTKNTDMAIRVSIIGRPNVGKSSLLNALARDNRSIVSDRPGTTRDNVDFQTEFKDKQIVFVDTAGLRRRGKIGQSQDGRANGQIEKYSSLRVFSAIESSDISLLLIDCLDGVTAQDLHIAGYALDHYQGLILVVNKWDLAETDQEDFLKYLNKKIGFLPFVPVIFISAKEKPKGNKLLELILGVYERRNLRISTAELNNKLQKAILKKSPPANRGVMPKIKYLTQIEVNPPTFAFFATKADRIHFSYARYLENRIRENWNFTGTPIKIIFKDKGKDESNRRARQSGK